MKKFLAPALAAAAIALACSAGGVAAYQANTSNYMQQGGAEWDIGSALKVLSGGTETVNSGGVINIATGGVVKFNGVDVTSNLAAAVANPVGGTAASIRVASGSGALSSGSLAATTGLTTITACSANLHESSTPGVATSIITETYSGGTATFYGWKVTNSSTTTLIAATATETVDWVCFGT